MDVARLCRVLEICVPIFALIAVGKIFAIKGFMTDEHRKFLNKLVYYYCLPPLVFLGVAQQDAALFRDSAVLLGCFLPVAAVAAIFMIFARLLRLRGGLAAAFVISTFYSNCAYVGFPLVQETFGATGFGVASLYNAVLIPFFLIFSLLIIDYYVGGRRFGAGLLRKVLTTLVNPIVIACFAGAACAALFAVWEPREVPVLYAAGKITAAALKLLASLGLPLSLLAVGGALHFGDLTANKLSLGLNLAGKLLIVPALSLLFFRMFYPETAAAFSGTVTLLHATPSAVVAYIIACQAGADENFVASQLAMSTVFSALTVPLWVYWLL